MRHLPLRPPSPALAVGLLALVVALAGAAWAAIPGPEGIIHGCYNKHTGALRVIDTAAHGKCKRGESELNWMEVGPPGPRGGGGPRGVTGKTGPEGPKGAAGGLSNAYTASESTTVPLSSTEPAKVLTLELPAGDYAVTASVEIANEDTKPGTEAATCTLKKASSTTGEATAVATVPFLEHVEGGEAQTVPLVGTWSLSATEALELACKKTSTGSGTVSAKLARIDAVDVGSITEG